ncbi:MAG: GMP synthase (glutamine-hydrolyzing) [Syntrophorhabdus sp. PtaU1.Bin050]|nr:MAG: GMP synthase (glutamine-hydrolyzing) [Syntrophorhabdus sp. PtaU1.Bin050]
MNGKVLVVKHVSNEGPGLIRTFFEGQGWPVELVDMSSGGRLPDSLEGIGAVIMLGGPMNAYEEDMYPFLQSEDRFIGDLIRQEIPFMGICLGAQLLAKACRANVFRANSEEIGWHEVKLTKEGARDILFHSLPHRLKVFQWHEDTFEIPEGGVLLAQAQSCTNQAFRVGRNAYGLQFHIEVTPDMVSSWMESEKKKVDAKKIGLETMEIRDLFESQVNMIFANFRRLVESSLRFKRIMKQYVEDRSWAERKTINWWDLRCER